MCCFVIVFFAQVQKCFVGAVTKQSQYFLSKVCARYCFTNDRSLYKGKEKVLRRVLQFYSEQTSTFSVHFCSGGGFLNIFVSYDPSYTVRLETLAVAAR